MPDERGVHADAMRRCERTLARRLRLAIQTDQAVVSTVRDAALAAAHGRRRLDAIDAEILAALADQQRLGLQTPAGTRRFSGFLAAKTRDIDRVVSDAAADATAGAALLRSLAGRYPVDDAAPRPTIQFVDDRDGHRGADAPGGSDDQQRRRNQIDAFVAIFGRQPRSPADWTMAAALDRHTYRDDFQGVESQVQIARIRPVPGQGVVRVGQWIPQHDVISYPPQQRDLGNSRDADPQFDPENTKVTTYIDYENGVVVLRQNPSVGRRPDGSAGQVRVGAPRGSITQADNGSVRIRYSAANPFAPGVFADTTSQSPIGHAFTVNGDLVFEPTTTGVVVGGTRTNYPSMEVYQDMPNADTRTVLIDPARSGSSVGPLFNLPRHHDIGAGGSAFAPFNPGGHPLPATDFTPTAITKAGPARIGRPN